MNIVGLIGTGVAFARYQKAKKAYEELVERKDTLQFSINAAATTKNSEVQKYLGESNNPNKELENLSVSATLNIKKFDKTLFKTTLSIDFSNTGSGIIYIRHIEADVFLNGKSVGFRKQQSTYLNNLVVAPGAVKSVAMPGGWAIVDVDTKADRQVEKANVLELVKEYGKGKDLGILTANVRIWWTAKPGGTEKEAYYEQKDGIVTYKS